MPKSFSYPLLKTLGRNSLHKVSLKFWMLSQKSSPRKAAKNVIQKQERKRLVEQVNTLQDPKNTKSLANHNARRHVGQISFQHSNMLPTVFPLNSSHGSLDIFELSPVLKTFVSCFDQKFGPIYSTIVATLEFESISGRNSFLYLQIFGKKLQTFTKCWLRFTLWRNYYRTI